MVRRGSWAAPAGLAETGAPDPPLHRSLNTLLITFFLLGIGLPGASLLVGTRADDGLGEKRTLAALPAAPVDPDALKRYPRRFEAYFADHFGFRTTLVRSYNEVFGRWLRWGDEDVVFGKNGWLYYRDTALRYRRAAPFDDQTLDAWVRTLQRRRDWLRDRGIEYVFAVSPNKDTIYPEFLPDHLAHHEGESRLDQLLRALRERTDVTIVDLRGPMLEAKPSFERLYHPADTHWNDFGAYVGYAALMQALTHQIEVGGPTPLEAFQRRSVPSLRDLANMLGLPEDYPSESIALSLPGARSVVHDEPRYRDNPFAPPQAPARVGEIADPSLPRAVVFRDSFGDPLIPLLSEHFSRIVYIWSEQVDGSIIEAEHPDVVISAMNERKLIAPPPEDSDALAGRSRVFRDAEPLLDIDASNAHELLDPSEDLAWTPGTDSALEVHGARPLVELPAVEPGGRILVRIAFESPAPTWSRLYYGTRERWSFSRDRSRVRYVTAGTHEFYFEIPSADFDGRLAFSPGRAEGTYVINAIQVRRAANETASLYALPTTVPDPFPYTPTPQAVAP